MKRCGELGNRDARGFSFSLTESFFQRIAEIAKASINFAQLSFGDAGDFSAQSPEQRAPDLQRALFERRKRPAGKEGRRLRGFFHRPRIEVRAEQRDFFELLRGGANGV